MSWQTILKMVKVGSHGFASGNWPLIYYLNPEPVKGEVFDDYYDRTRRGQYGVGGDKYTQRLSTKTSANVQVSNYGRVKEDGKILKPKERNGKYSTMITGDSRAFVPYKFTVWELRLDDSEDPNAYDNEFIYIKDKASSQKFNNLELLDGGDFGNWAKNNVLVIGDIETYPNGRKDYVYYTLSGKKVDEDGSEIVDWKKELDLSEYESSRPPLPKKKRIPPQDELKFLERQKSKTEQRIKNAPKKTRRELENKLRKLTQKIKEIKRR